MSSRNTILEAVRRNKPARVPAPVITAEECTVYDDVVSKFIATLESIGGSVTRGQRPEQLQQELQGQKSKGLQVADLVFGVGNYPPEAYRDQEAKALEEIFTVCIRGSIAVAENGAVWVPEAAMGNRLLPFIGQHLVLVLREDEILSNMHQAYERIEAFADGFGVFIAGPSKTADIEQSLVIGAHGARSLRVFLVNGK